MTVDMEKTHNQRPLQIGQGELMTLHNEKSDSQENECQNKKWEGYSENISRNKIRQKYISDRTFLIALVFSECCERTPAFIQKKQYTIKHNRANSDQKYYIECSRNASVKRVDQACGLPPEYK